MGSFFVHGAHMGQNFLLSIQCDGIKCVKYRLLHAFCKVSIDLIGSFSDLCPNCDMIAFKVMLFFT